MPFNVRCRELVVFATSGLPDPYVNCITHSVLYLDVRSVTIVLITESDSAPAPEDASLATQISRVITEQFDAISSGNYLYRSSPAAAPSMKQLQVPDAGGCYRRVLDILNTGGLTALVVPITELYYYLREKSRSDCLFDVTGLRKSLLMNIAAALLALDNSNAYSFDLKRKPHFDQTDLFHYLKAHEDYEYRNLLSSPLVQTAVRRLRRWTLQAKFLGLAALVLLCIGLALLRLESTAARSGVKWLAYMSLASSVASITSFLTPFVRKTYD